MVIEAIELRLVELPLAAPFRASWGEISKKSALIIAVRSTGGMIGWGEASVLPTPFYEPETPAVASHVLEHYAIPLILEAANLTGAQAHSILSRIVGNSSAKAGLETAIWDLEAKEIGIPLARHLGAATNNVPAGVTISLYDDFSRTVDAIHQQRDEGYRRIKIKISSMPSPSSLQRIREAAGSATLVFDANESLDNVPLEDFELFRGSSVILEQPFRRERLLPLARLQRKFDFMIALDESAHSFEAIQTAHALGSGKIIVAKTARLGGIGEILRLRQYCLEAGLQLSIGGMLEMGIGRAHNVAIAGLSGFAVPGDLSANSRFYAHDIVQNPFILKADGTLQVPEAPGIGVTIDSEILERYTLQKKSFSRSGG